MKIENHNPDYVLVSVVMDKKEFVYGEDFKGQNKGLEVYHLHTDNPANGHKRSYRYLEGNIPQIYTELYNNLKQASKDICSGKKMYFTAPEYKDFVKSNHIPATAQLCRCNNCMAIMVDKNPSDQPAFTIPADVNELIWHVIDNDHENNNGAIWACPNCLTDHYLIDVTEIEQIEGLNN